MFVMLMQMNPELLSAMGGGFSQVQRELERIEKHKELKVTPPPPLLLLPLLLLQLLLLWLRLLLLQLLHCYDAVAAAAVEADAT